MHKVRVVISRSSEHIYLYFHVHSYQSLISFLFFLHHLNSLKKKKNSPSANTDSILTEFKRMY